MTTFPKWNFIVSSIFIASKFIALRRPMSPLLDFIFSLRIARLYGTRKVIAQKVKSEATTSKRWQNIRSSMSKNPFRVDAQCKERIGCEWKLPLSHGQYDVIICVLCTRECNRKSPLTFAIAWIVNECTFAMAISEKCQSFAETTIKKRHEEIIFAGKHKSICYRSISVCIRVDWIDAAREDWNGRKMCAIKLSSFRSSCTVALPLEWHGQSEMHESK